MAAWAALVPLLVFLKESRQMDGLRAGFFVGLISNIGIFYWISYVIATYGNASIYYGIGAMLLLSGFLALFTAAFAGGVVYFRLYGISAIVSAPLLWTVLEWIKSHIFTGFPWGNLAYSQQSWIPVIQISDVTGTYGVTFLVVFVNAVLADVLTCKLRKEKVVKLATAVALITAVCLYGF